MSQINAFMFVVPNRIDVVTAESSPVVQDIVIHNNNDLASKLGYKIDGKAVEYNLNEPLVQVWVGNDSEDNWVDHSLPAECYTKVHSHEVPTFGSRLPTFIPAKYLQGKKEGDHLIININGVEVDVVCNQQSYRYQHAGKFEQALESVLA